jgi:hypothetical protein
LLPTPGNLFKKILTRAQNCIQPYMREYLDADRCFSATEKNSLPIFLLQTFKFLNNDGFDSYLDSFSSVLYIILQISISLTVQRPVHRT